MSDNGPERDGRERKTESSPLTGKLFDEVGERLTPSHAIKSGRRYRYYVSNALVTGTANQHQGWRIPAQQIERCVKDATRALLHDRSALSSAARKSEIAADRLQFLFEAAERFTGDPIDLVERVALRQDGLTLTLLLARLAGEDMPNVAHHVPMAVKRRGVEMRLVIDGPGPVSRKADPILLKAIARARGWFDDLVVGRASSLAAIAAREGITDRYVSHLLPLAFLAPDIVEAISVGRQPVGLTVEALVRRIDLPFGWDEQKALLGFV